MSQFYMKTKVGLLEVTKFCKFFYIVVYTLDIVIF